MSKQVQPKGKPAPAVVPAKIAKKPSLLDDDDDDDFRMEPKEGGNKGGVTRSLSNSALFDLEEFLSLDEKGPLPSYYSSTTTKMENIRKLSTSPLIDADELTDGEETLSDVEDDSPRMSPAVPSSKLTPSNKGAQPTQFSSAKNSSPQSNHPQAPVTPVANKPGAVTVVKQSGKMTTISISQKDFAGALPTLMHKGPGAPIPQPLHNALAAASPYVSAAVAKSLFHKSKSEQSQSSSDDPDWLEQDDMDEDVEDFLLRDDDELDNDDFLNSVDHLHIK